MDFDQELSFDDARDDGLSSHSVRPIARLMFEERDIGCGCFFIVEEPQGVEVLYLHLHVIPMLLLDVGGCFEDGSALEGSS